MFVQGCWVAELSELSAMRRSQEARVKSFLTLRHDQYVPKYANSAVSYPRRTVFIGTTNDEAQYLAGQTGNTRFLPVKTRALDLEGLQDRRDQLLAEALAYYKDHPDDWWQPPLFLEDVLKEEREDRRASSVWEEPLAQWLNGAQADKAHLALGDIMAGALGIPKADWVRHQQAAGAAMRALGWEYRRTSRADAPDSKQYRAWHRPAPEEKAIEEPQRRERH